MENSDSEEKMSNLKRKGKEIMVEDVVYVDENECLDNNYNDNQLGGSYKGSNCWYVSNEDKSDDDNKGAQSSTSASAATSGILNGEDLNGITTVSSDMDQDEFNFFDDDDLEYDSENQWYGMDEISHLQAQFDKADIPTDMEVVIPWWTEPTQSYNLNGLSDSSSSQAIFNPGLDQMYHAHDTKLTGGTMLPSDFSCTNGSKSDPSKHGSSPTNNQTDFIDPTPTELHGENSGSSTTTNLKETAMTRLRQFEKFAVVEDYSDHHFARTTSKTQLEKASAKKVQDEWRILQSSLPDTIFVRAYESQMNLLRVAIIGPQGTPYHDGLFFFDVKFPSDYPNRPPEVYYHSGGLRINPNLYACGKVCLSLLGTWPGKSVTENWIPGKSTLLQVLVSIQALILNANPYFNEPGYDIGRDIYSLSKSEHYSEETLINSLKTMIYSMRKPPKNFEEFVPDHFVTHARDILLTCKEYKNGAQVGSISIVDGAVTRENDKNCSSYFKDRVGFSMNCLIDEFAKLGVNDCEEFRVSEASNIKKPPEGWMGKPFFEMLQSHALPPFGSIESSKAKFDAISSHYAAPTARLPVPHGTYSFQEFRPTFKYAIPNPPNVPLIINRPLSYIPMRSPQLVMARPRAVYFPPPHIAMSSPPTAWEPQSSVQSPASANSSAWRHPSPRPSTHGVRPNSWSDSNPGNYSWPKGTKPDDLSGYVHKWRDS